jgi:hypothetical protein
MHLIMPVVGAFGKQRVESSKEFRQKIAPVVQTGGEALIEISRCRVEGAKHRSLVLPQETANFSVRCDVDCLESPLRGQFEFQFGRLCHQVARDSRERSATVWAISIVVSSVVTVEDKPTERSHSTLDCESEKREETKFHVDSTN